MLSTPKRDTNCFPLCPSPRTVHIRNNDNYDAYRQQREHHLDSLFSSTFKHELGCTSMNSLLAQSVMVRGRSTYHRSTTQDRLVCHDANCVVTSSSPGKNHYSNPTTNRITAISPIPIMDLGQVLITENQPNLRPRSTPGISLIPPKRHSPLHPEQRQLGATSISGASIRSSKRADLFRVLF